MEASDGMIETYRGVVYPAQLDHMGHMNVQWYAAKFDEATWHLCSAIGITSSYMRDQHRGMAALEQITRYKSEVVSGEPLIVKSRVLEIRDKFIRFLHVMVDAESGDEVASTEIMGIHLDTSTRKSCSMPASVIENCQEMFEITL